MASTLRYLTVQDVLWINLQVTKKVNHFNYARLEEATFYQYAYGDSNTLIPQSARFLAGFLRMHPIETGNEATAFVALLAFLRINGLSIDLSDEDATEWFSRASASSGVAREAISSIVHETHDHHGELPDVPQMMGEVLADYPLTVSSLAEKSTAHAA